MEEVIIETEPGSLVLGATEGRLCMCDWITSSRHKNNKQRILKELKTKKCKSENSNDIQEKNISSEKENEENRKIIEKAQKELNEYFERKREEFDIALLLIGTEFQKKVWEELKKIKYGETLTYGELAERLGMKAGVRAVASAVGRNPLSIFIGCHRITGVKDAGGYAGGVEVKKALLKHEKNN